MDKNKYYYLFIGGYVSLSLSFILFYSIIPNPYDFILKMLPATLASVAAAMFAVTSKRKLLVVAFLGCAIGDMLLGINRVTLFMPALVSFMAANVILAVYLSKQSHRNTFSYIRLGITIVYTIIVSIVLIPSSGKIAVPVTLYILVIATMTATAALYKGRKQWIVFAGAQIFMIGDSLIAFDKFVYPFNNSLVIIFSCYYTAIFLISTGLTQRPRSAINRKIL
mgnify:CR=1 FL=1